MSTFVNRLRSFLQSNENGRILINCRRILRQKINKNRYDDYAAVDKIYRLKVGRELELKNPQRFTEKLQWLKLFYRNPLMVVCADKVAVRDWLSSLGYADLLVPIVGVYSSPDDIEWCKIPEKCIFKASHGSSMHLVKKSQMDRMPFSWKVLMKTWLEMDISIDGREWPYGQMPRKIICEEFIEANTASKLKDYKFFCFNGHPIYVQVDSDLLEDHHIDFYDIAWNKLDLRCQYQNSSIMINKPVNFSQMLDIASRLSKNFPHVRVDFYEYDEILKIGELTFFDGSGFYNFNPDKWDFEWGKQLVLPEPNYNLELYNRINQKA